MAKKEELIEQAKTLGIPTEGLTVAQLEAAIKNVATAPVVKSETEIKEVELTRLIKVAESLEIETEGLDANALKIAIFEKNEEIGIKLLMERAEMEGVDTEGLTPEQISIAISKATALRLDVYSENETPEDNPTVKRQKAAKAARDEAAEKSAKKKAAAKAKEEEANSKASTTAKKAEKDTRPVFTDERKLKFRFKKTAPKTLNIDGVSQKIEDIIEDEEIMLELVNGNSNFLEQIH